MKDRIIFLDFDGPVNNILFSDKYKGHEGELIATWAHPSDGFVNNYQALCWLNHLYDTYPFDIVVTSSWRECASDEKAGLKLCRNCLYKGGLDKKIKVIDVVKFGSNRSDLINEWIKDNDFKGDYLIIDDDDYYTEKCSTKYRPTNYAYMTERFIKVDSLVGITVSEYGKARDTFDLLKRRSYFEDKYYKCTVCRYENEEKTKYTVDGFTCINPPMPENIELSNTEKDIKISYIIEHAYTDEMEYIENVIECERFNEFHFTIKTKKAVYVFDLI